MWSRFVVTNILLFIILLLSFSGCEQQKPRTIGNDITENKRRLPVPDEHRLVEYVRAQLQWGPRIPGTPAHDSCRRWLVSMLKMWVDTVFEQYFTVNVYGRAYRCSNIVAQLFPERKERVLLSAHWDSRPYADEDTGFYLRSQPVPGANDGASGVAVILELVRLIHSKPPTLVGLDIALFDAEDMGLRHDEQMFCLGSKYFAAHYPFTLRPRYGILFDMVGDHQAQFHMEQNSYQAAPAVVERIWKLGQYYGNGYFRSKPGISVVDDHLPLIEIGIPTVNIIDDELVGNRSLIKRRQYWHTTRDNLDNISGRTMSKVVTVILHLLYSDSPIPL